MPEAVPDRLSWAEIRQLALRHRKALLLANLLAVLGVLASVPIPLLLPLLRPLLRGYPSRPWLLPRIR